MVKKRCGKRSDMVKETSW